jgi:urocanate hydratase
MSSISVGLPSELPPAATFEPNIRRAPDRGLTLTQSEVELALKNALRYVPASLHSVLAAEFADELRTRGRIYAYRYRPSGAIRGRPIDEYRGRCVEAKAIQVMIDNNLDFAVALYPYELVTYGETGQVFQNWLQYRLVQQYLEQMRDDQTLVLVSGHPMGLFTTRRDAPRLISTNGLMVGMFDTPAEFHRATQLGVANYGQMTAGGFMYIGPQGIVHGTYLTLLNAARLYRGAPAELPPDGAPLLAGYLFVTSGLGGMSGAQPKAAKIAGAVSITAEVEFSRIETRHSQGWVDRVSADLAECVAWARDAVARRAALSIAYHGNVVDLIAYLADHRVTVDLLSDQTSCHAVYEGGYNPRGLTYDAARALQKSDFAQFKQRVDQSLKDHIEQIERLVAQGARFWDYGNSFLKAVFDAGVTRVAKGGDVRRGFIFPSYVEDVMGPVCFDYGYGPFRWICLSGKHSDLQATDQAAMHAIDVKKRAQDRDNYAWIRDAEQNKLVVGTQARILYADAATRVRIALAFNQLVRAGTIGPVMLGRDHHDTGGTDSPFRETSNIKDGSNIMSDMAHHAWAGGAARGMTMCVLSNGGGVGTGKSINGGFGLVLDGSERCDQIIRSALDFDTMVGVARRSWARNDHAIEAVREWNAERAANGEHITEPTPIADESILAHLAAQVTTRK